MANFKAPYLLKYIPDRVESLRIARKGNVVDEIDTIL
jgi:hypothetical protein